MEFIGMGTTEILVVLLIALAIFGPQRMVDIARKMGRFVREVSKVGSQLTKTLTEENLPTQEKQIVQDLKKIGSEIRQTVTDAARPASDTARQVSQPPAPPAEPPTGSVPVLEEAEPAAAPARPAFADVPSAKNPAQAPKETSESKTP